jgi:hypothetical protein
MGEQLLTWRKIGRGGNAGRGCCQHYGGGHRIFEGGKHLSHFYGGKDWALANGQAGRARI